LRGLRVVLLGIAIAAAICGTGEARSRYHHRHHSPSGAPARVEPEGRWIRTGGAPAVSHYRRSTIRGCTALINLRRDRELRATAYYNRANAYFSKGDLSNAINDYGEALQINRNTSKRSTIAPLPTARRRITRAPSPTTVKC